MNAEALDRKLVDGAIVSFDTNAGLGSTVVRAARILALRGVEVHLSVIMVGEHLHQERRQWPAIGGGRGEYKPEHQIRALERYNIRVAPIDVQDALTFQNIAYESGVWQDAKRRALQEMLALQVLDHSETVVQGIQARSVALPALSAEAQLRHLLSLPDHRHGLQLPSLGTNRNYPATVDWWIRAQAQRRGWIMVTNDTGDEWNNLANRVTKTTFDIVLSRIPLPL